MTTLIDQLLTDFSRSF